MDKKAKSPLQQDPAEVDELDRIRLRDEAERRADDRDEEPEFVKGTIDPPTKK